MSKPKLTDLLNSLSPEDLGEVIELIQNKATQQGDSTEEPKKGRKQKRGKQTTNQNSGRKQQRGKIILPDDPEHAMPREKPLAGPRQQQGRSTSSRRRNNDDFDLHEHRRRRSAGRGGKGAQARAESLSTGPRPNTFESMPLRNAHKADTQIDRLLSGGNEITERREPVQYIEIQCKRCKRWYDVLPSALHVDADRGTSYICDNCSIVSAGE